MAFKCQAFNVMNDMKRTFKELKLALTVPRVYLANYFDQLRNEIDTACELFTQLPQATGILDTQITKQAREYQALMIDEVTAFEQMCLFNSKNKQMEANVATTGVEMIRKLEQNVENLEQDNSRQIRDIRELISTGLFDAQKCLFMSKALIFLTRDEYRREFEYSEVLNNVQSSVNSVSSFGILIVVENDFIAKNKLIECSGCKQCDGWYDKQYLNVLLLKQALSKTPKGAINRIHLNRNSLLNNLMPLDSCSD